MNTNLPDNNAVVRVHFFDHSAGMWGYYDHARNQWWVRGGDGFRPAHSPPIGWSPAPKDGPVWHDAKKTTPGDPERTSLLYYSKRCGYWTGRWVMRGGAEYWTELPEPPKREFKVGGVYAMPGLSGPTARITDITILNGKTILFGRYGDNDRPGVWDETGHALPFEPHDKVCDLVLS